MSFSQRLATVWKRRVWLKVRRRWSPETELRLAGGRLRVDLRDQIISSLLYLEGEYEPEVQRFMQASELEGKICVDIGANIGLHTLHLSRLAGSKGRVYCFEPQSRNFELLQRNIELNGASNVVARRAAVGSRDGVCKMAVNATNFGDHRVSSGAGATEEVPMVTIDSVLADLPANSINFIKVDVQGHETEVVRGMQHTLKRNPDAVLFIEVFPEGLEEAGTSASELVRSLNDSGLDGWEFQDFRLIPCQQPRVYDLIRDGKYQDLVLSRGGKRVTRILESLYGVSLQDTRQHAVIR